MKCGSGSLNSDSAVRIVGRDTTSASQREVGKEFHQAGLRPEAHLARIPRNKCAVTAALRRDQTDVGVVCQPQIGKTRERNEGVILRRYDQSGYANSIRELQRAGAVIVIG